MRFFVFIRFQNLPNIEKQVVAETKQEALIKIMRRLNREKKYKSIDQEFINKVTYCQNCLDSFQQKCEH